MASENVENIKLLVRVVVVLVAIVDEFSDYVVHLFTKLCRTQQAPHKVTLYLFFSSFQMANPELAQSWSFLKS